MTESDIRRLMVALARIEVSVEAVRAENLLGQEQHKDFEGRLRELERIDPIDVESRLRGLERVRWIMYGAAAVLGSGITAAVTRLLGGN